MQSSMAVDGHNHNNANAVFRLRPSVTRTAGAMAKEIEKGLQERHGLDVRATLRTKDELVAALDGLPRELLGARYVTLSFLFDKPTAAKIKDLRTWDVSPERIVLGDRVAYIAYAEGVHGSKLTTAALEKKLGVATTARTPETVRKLLAQL